MVLRQQGLPLPAVLWLEGLQGQWKVHLLNGRTGTAVGSPLPTQGSLPPPRNATQHVVEHRAGPSVEDAPGPQKPSASSWAKSIRPSPVTATRHVAVLSLRIGQLKGSLWNGLHGTSAVGSRYLRFNNKIIPIRLIHSPS